MDIESEKKTRNSNFTATDIIFTIAFLAVCVVCAIGMITEGVY